ncbi:replication initiation factor domain-containing protein [Enterococcus casseliflavus]|uniref:replication initiation factor domain-containing protein n=1 Tax=Enterococcus casseliflavus TaxID=37734 RepID=UPI00163D8057|nr:replication initiation factor domain-containing protein [Enterococcus casseliflavus]
MDLSLDDYKGVLDLTELKKIKSGYFTTNFRNYDVIQSQNLSNNDSNELTLYLGSRKSSTHFCCYQKDYEQRRKRGISLEDVKVINRYDLRYKKERAEKLAEKILYYPDFSMLFRFSKWRNLLL